MEDDAIRIAVGRYLGSSLYKPHQCSFVNMVNTRGNHSLSCKKSAVRTLRHNYLNDLNYNALLQAGLPLIKEAARLLRTDGKRPNGLIPTCLGKLANQLCEMSLSPIHSLIPIKHLYVDDRCCCRRA